MSHPKCVKRVLTMSSRGAQRRGDLVLKVCYSTERKIKIKLSRLPRPPVRRSRNDKTIVFRQTDRVQKVVKTSKPSASAYDGTVELGLRCKSKCLAQQAFEVLFCCIGDTFAIAYLNTDRQPPKICILTIGDFFDTLTERTKSFPFFLSGALPERWRRCRP